jgi:hypothetical protein
VLWALRDRKAALTFLVGGIALRSLIRVLAMILTGATAVLLFEWLILGVALRRGFVVDVAKEDSGNG